MNADFISSEDNDGKQLMHSKGDNIEIMIGDETGKSFFQSLLTRYQTGAETLIKSSNFVFDSIYGMCYKCHKVNLNRDGLYIDSPDRIKTKKQQ